MENVTLDDVVKRLEVLERVVGVAPPSAKRDWRTAWQAITDPEAHRLIDEEGAKLREAEH